MEIRLETKTGQSGAPLWQPTWRERLISAGLVLAALAAPRLGRAARRRPPIEPIHVPRHVVPQVHPAPLARQARSIAGSV